VYRATATTDTQETALAVKEPRMSGTINTDDIDQMLEEADTWQQLDDHEHIVSVVDYGEKPLPWIGMEYMDGGDLGRRIGKLPFEQALWTAVAITKGVRHAHKMGVAHLDLKPENILFRSVTNAWDVPKVADWGLSKHMLEHSQSVTGLSPQYAAPEQFDPEQFGATDTVTDVYQLGAVFYELFTGQPLFDGETYEIINKVQSETPSPPSQKADLPQGLDNILLQAVATDKQDRYEDIILLRNDLLELWDAYN
jgi:Serine/threonine protein kinase